MFLLAALIGAACRGGAPQGPPPGAPVKVEVAKTANVEDSTEYVADLRSRNSTAVMPQVEGQITEIFVRAGEHVAADAPLMQIDPAKQAATLKSQEDLLQAKRAALAYARAQYERMNGLAGQGISSQQDLDTAHNAFEAAEADLRSTEAQVREQQVQLHYYTVKAPRDGIVGDIPVRVGDRVTVATQLTTVDQPGGLEAYIYVPVERSAQLKPGTPVHIVDAAGATLAETRVTFVSPQVDTQTQTVLAKARLDDAKGLRPAQFIRARVVWSTHEAPVVPVLAVSRIAGQYFAFVAEPKDGGLVARQRQVRVGDIVGNDYVVLDGIKAGERVVVSGTQFVQDGAPIAPQG